MNYSVPSVFFEIPFLENISLESIASLVFLFVIVFAFFVSLIMFYHWKKYSFSGKSFLVAELIYIVVAVVLISTAFLGLK